MRVGEKPKPAGNSSLNSIVGVTIAVGGSIATNVMDGAPKEKIITDAYIDGLFGIAAVGYGAVAMAAFIAVAPASVAVKACLGIPAVAFVVTFICLIIRAIISSQTGQSDFYVVPKTLMYGTPIPCMVFAIVGMHNAKKLKLQGVENTRKYTVLGIVELAWFGFASVLTVLYRIV